MKLTIEVDQSKWKCIADEIEQEGRIVSVYKHDKYIYSIIYSWDNGIYTIVRPCGMLVCCVLDMMVAQAIVELIVTNQS